MHVIWKRPDGFHGAHPSDYKVVDIAAKSRIWLHKEDHENYPFRVSSDWQGEEQTKKLNYLINLIAYNYDRWRKWIEQQFDNSKFENVAEFLGATDIWLDKLKKHAKGDHWEVEIIHESIDEIKKKLRTYRSDIVKDIG